MKFLRRTYAVLCREVGRIRKYPIYWVIMIVLPLLSFAFFAVLFENGVPTDIPVAVLDEDNSELSRTVGSMIDATPTAEVRYGIQSMEEGEAMMRAGEIQAIILIPHNFEKDIYNITQTHVEAYISGLNISVNGLLNRDIQTAVVTFSTGIQIQTLMKQGMTEAQAYTQVLPVSFDKHVLFNPYTNYAYYLLPSFLPMMLLIFTIMATIFAIGTELKGSTAGEWFRVAEGSLGAALVGKLLPVTVAMFTMSVVMSFVMFVIVGAPMNGSFLLFTLAGFEFVLCYQAIGMMIISVLNNMRLSLSIGGGYSVLAFTFSGLTFPLMAMSPLARGFSRIFPFTFYTDIFVDQALRGAPIVYSLLDMLWMSLFIILPMLALPRLKRVATDSKYWGRI